MLEHEPKQGILTLTELPGQKVMDFDPPVDPARLEGIRVLAKRPDGKPNITSATLNEAGNCLQVVLSSSVFWAGGTSFAAAGREVAELLSYEPVIGHPDFEAPPDFPITS